MDGSGIDYRGYVAVTNTGKTCQKWTSQVPHAPNSVVITGIHGIGDHNYCRNPDSEPGPWCYTMDPAVRWEFCDVGDPSPVCY